MHFGVSRPHPRSGVDRRTPARVSRQRLPDRHSGATEGPPRAPAPIQSPPHLSLLPVRSRVERSGEKETRGVGEAEGFCILAYFL